MADIFISYARADRDRIEKLASALEGEGYSVWWDRHIQSGAEFSKDIETELQSARAVIVAWSKEANDSRWVKDESNEAAEAGKLLAISLDGEQPPLGFRQYHTVDFAGWPGSADAPAFGELANAVRAKLTGDDFTPPPLGAASVRKPAGAGIHPAIWITAIVFAAIVAIIWIGVSRWDDERPVEETAAENGVENSRSIAVLPFAALSMDESDEYLGKGVAEELLNALAQFPDLKVAARTSAFSFEGKDADIREIASQLGVSHILEGSVRRSDDRLRVTAQLIRAADGFHLWSNTYEKETTDVFAIQDEIVRDITRTLEVRLGVGAGAGRAGGEGVNPRAYAEYLRGLTLWGDRDRAFNNRFEAIKAFQNAVGLDAEFADAWAALGFACAFSAGSPIGIDADEIYHLATEAFDRALSLDQDSAIAHSGLVYLRATYDVDIESARTHLDRALLLSPNLAETHYAAALYWRMVGDVEKTIAAYNRAVALDPLNMTTQRLRAQFLVQVGRVEEAFAFFDACQAHGCLKTGFPVYAMVSAIQSRDPNRMAAWLPVFETFEAEVRSKPASQVVPVEWVFSAYVSIALNRPDKAAQIQKMKDLFAQDNVTDVPGIWAPMLATEISADIIIDNLHKAYDQHTLFSTPVSFSPYYGSNPYPEGVLRHPGYHALWRRPGMAALADARRANGWDDGLPLPMDGVTGGASIAVLPFADLSQARDQQYFADGISEEILNVLARVDGLKVASRTSSFRYRDGGKAMGEIARELGVRYLVEGSVRKAGDNLRITAQLIDGESDAHLWSQTFDRTLTVDSIFDIQDGISSAIVEKIGAGMGLGRSNALKFAAAAGTDDLRAYDAFLEGRQMLDQRDDFEPNDILAKLEEVVRLDPEFARGWSQLAAAYAAQESWRNTDRDYRALAKAAADKALALDAGLAMPHAVIGMTAKLPDGRPDKMTAVAQLTRAIELDPNDPLLWGWRGQHLTELGFFKEAERDFDRAIELNDSDVISLVWRFKANIYDGTIEDYVENIGPQLRRNPFLNLHLLIGTIAAGDQEQKIRRFNESRAGEVFSDKERAALVSVLTDPAADADAAYLQFWNIDISRGAMNLNATRPIWLYAFRKFDDLKDLPDLVGDAVWWLRAHDDYLTSPARYRLMTEQGLPDYWRAKGFPPQCRAIDPLTDGRDYACD